MMTSNERPLDSQNDEFEQPGGRTVFERMDNSEPQKRLSRGVFNVFPDMSIPDMVAMFRQAEFNEALRTALEHAILLYKLGKNDDGRT